MSLRSLISAAASIDEEDLLSVHLSLIPLATKMAWAATRMTTRLEDMHRVFWVASISTFHYFMGRETRLSFACKRRFWSTSAVIPFCVGRWIQSECFGEPSQTIQQCEMEELGTGAGRAAGTLHSYEYRYLGRLSRFRSIWRLSHFCSTWSWNTTTTRWSTWVLQTKKRAGQNISNHADSFVPQRWLYKVWTWGDGCSTARNNSQSDIFTKLTSHFQHRHWH